MQDPLIIMIMGKFFVFVFYELFFLLYRSQLSETLNSNNLITKQGSFFDSSFFPDGYHGFDFSRLFRNRFRFYDDDEEEEETPSNDYGSNNGNGNYADCQNADSWPQSWINYENRVVDLVNARRRQGANCGGYWYSAVPSVRLNSRLTRSSRCHAADMTNNGYFSHTSQDGRSISDRVHQAGYSMRAVGENIAYGQQSPEAVVEGWMNSPGHCANIMKNFKEIGVGFVAGKNMWVQTFGTSF